MEPPSQSGCCVWFTGLPGSGKTTIAQALAAQLVCAGCSTKVLDGDSLRKTLSPDLGFTRQDRDRHIRRVGELAVSLVRTGHIVLCATISPYRMTRQECRAMMDPEQFIEVFVDAPLALCEARDPKGLFRQARQGAIQHFTGVSDPYEPPETPDVTLDTADHSVEENVQRLQESLVARGILPKFPVISQ